MIDFILGAPGSGKTAQIIHRVTEALRAEKEVILLVPEQQAVITEQAVANELSKHSDVPFSELQVVNFTRLCDLVFREYGGLSYNYIDDGTRALVMWQALYDIAPMLREYSSCLNHASRFIDIMLDEAKELKTYGVTPEDLKRASEHIEAEAENNPYLRRLAGRLYDLSLINAAYNAVLHVSYSDMQDSLTKLAELLRVHDYFSSKTVFIDSFSFFTPQELDVLYYIFNQSPEVTLALCTLPGNSALYENTNRTFETLKRLIRRDKEIKSEVLIGFPRFSAPVLTHIAKNFWQTPSSGNVFQGNTNNVKIIAARDIYSEAEYTASDILRRIREDGLRYRDIAVIMRNVSDYDGIIDAAFEKYGIPFHMSKRIPLYDKPIFKLVLSALAVHAYNWRCDDVIVYIKSGLTSLDIAECDMLETYARTWNINGRSWYTEDGWFMNPDGYSDVVTESSYILLGKLNSAREKLIQPIMKLFEVFTPRCKVKDICRALYTFLLECGVKEKIADSDDDENVQLWNALCGALDKLYDTLPDMSVNSEQFSQLLVFVIRQTDIGTIPAHTDEVTIGSSDRLRVGNVKHTYLLGATEGVFPAAPTDDGFFSDSDKVMLEGIGITLSPTSDIIASDELYQFFRASLTPSESLTITYPKSGMDGTDYRPSTAVKNIMSICGITDAVDFLPYADENMAERERPSLLYALNDSPEGKALREYYMSKPEYGELLNAMKKPLSENSEQLGTESIRTLFGNNNIYISQSRLESYVMCAFGYHCKYSLRLSEEKKASFRALDTGNFIHRVLEQFMCRIKCGDKIDTDISEDELVEITDRVISDYVKNVFGQNELSAQSNRVREMFIRLRRSVLVMLKNLLEEFRQSDFVPMFFELPIDYTSENGIQPLSIPLSEDMSVSIYGKIDRVDVYKKNGDAYVRIVDYKTGSKSFSLSDIYYGLNMQMLLYLFTIWSDKNGRFKKMINCDGEIIPAGVLYYTAKTAEVNASPNESEADILKAVSEKLKRDGLLLNDADILKAMEKKLNGLYIPVKSDKNGEPKQNKSLISLEQMGALYRQVCGKVAEVANELTSGAASPLPVKSRLSDPCRYCAMKPVCRHES